jgi:hypothetical protein
MPGGGVHLFLSPIPETEDALEWTEAADVTSYLLYALDRTDWIDEWQLQELEILEKWEQEQAEEERTRLKAKFRLIQGGAESSDV